MTPGLTLNLPALALPSTASLKGAAPGAAAAAKVSAGLFLELLGPLLKAAVAGAADGEPGGREKKGEKKETEGVATGVVVASSSIPAPIPSPLPLAVGVPQLPEAAAPDENHENNVAPAAENPAPRTGVPAAVPERHDCAAPPALPARPLPHASPALELPEAADIPAPRSEAPKAAPEGTRKEQAPATPDLAARLVRENRSLTEAAPVTPNPGPSPSPAPASTADKRSVELPRTLGAPQLPEVAEKPAPRTDAPEAGPENTGKRQAGSSGPASAALVFAARLVQETGDAPLVAPDPENNPISETASVTPAPELDGTPSRQPVPAGTVFGNRPPQAMAATQAAVPPKGNLAPPPAAGPNQRRPEMTGDPGIGHPRGTHALVPALDPTQAEIPQEQPAALSEDQDQPAVRPGREPFLPASHPNRESGSAAPARPAAIRDAPQKAADNPRPAANRITPNDGAKPAVPQPAQGEGISAVGTDRHDHPAAASPSATASSPSAPLLFAPAGIHPPATPAATQPALAKSDSSPHASAVLLEPPATDDRSSAVKPEPAREISLVVPGKKQDGVEVRVVERAGEVHVSVRTPDPELARNLRQDLGQLITRLEEKGYHAETWRPAQVSAGSFSNERGDRGASGDTAQQSTGGNRGQGGEDQRDSGQQQKNRPRWLEELERTFGQEP